MCFFGFKGTFDLREPSFKNKPLTRLITKKLLRKLDAAGLPKYLKNLIQELYETVADFIQFLY